MSKELLKTVVIITLAHRHGRSLAAQDIVGGFLLAEGFHLLGPQSLNSSRYVEKTLLCGIISLKIILFREFC